MLLTKLSIDKLFRRCPEETAKFNQKMALEAKFRFERLRCSR